MSQSSSLPAPVEKPLLLGPPRKMPNDRLPTKLDVLLHFHFTRKMNPSTNLYEAAKIVVDDIMSIWEKCFLITSIFQDRYTIINKVLNLHTPTGKIPKFCYIKENKKFAINVKKYPIEVCRKKHEPFLKFLNQFFDIARCRASNVKCTCQHCSVLLPQQKKILYRSRKGFVAKISSEIGLSGTILLMAQENLNISAPSTSQDESNIEFSQENNESSSSDISIASNDNHFDAEKNQNNLDISNVLSYAIRKKISNGLLVELLNAFLLDLKENNVMGISDIPYFTIAQVKEQRKIHENQNFFD